MASIGIICGMVSEVRTLGRWAEHREITVGVSGARPDRAEEIAARMIAEDHVRLLVSWGIAGGLDPALPAGTITVPSSLVSPCGQEASLAAHLLDYPTAGRVVGADAVVTTAACKAALHASSQAMAVDMETHRVVRAAAGRVPCLAIRAISDPAGRALPLLVGSAISEAGRPRIGRVLLGLARHPWELWPLIRAGQDSAKAHAALRSSADAIFRQLLD